MPADHAFQAVAFPDNVPLRALSALFPDAQRTATEVRVTRPEGGTLFLYPFGAVVFADVEPAVRARCLEELRAREPRFSGPGTLEDLVVREDASAEAGMN